MCGSTSKSIAKNTLLNLAGQVIPLAVGIIAFPVLIHTIGVQRFGLLSLAWLVFGYFTILDLGMGRSATKHIAEAIGRGTEHEISNILWSAIVVQLAMGIVGAIILFSCTTTLVESILRIPSGLEGEACSVFRILSFGIPVVVISASFSGALEGAQRFDLLNAVRVPATVGMFLLPMFGGMAGLKLPVLVLFVLAIRIFALIAFGSLTLKIFPDIRIYPKRLKMIGRLFRFGAWITVSNIIGPFLLYFDRFLITSLISIEALSYYVAPAEALSRFAMIPISLTMSLFPAFSMMAGQGDLAIIERVFAGSVKYLVLIIGPIIMGVIIFAEFILQLWLGGTFVGESSAVLRIIAFGVLVNSLAFIPYALMQGLGRPDLNAKIHLMEVGIYLPIAYLFIRKWQINGAALAWTLRVILDTVLMYFYCLRTFKLRTITVVSNGLNKALLGLGFLIVVTFILVLYIRDLAVLPRIVIYVAALCLFYLWSWKNALGHDDQEMILGLFKA